SLVTYCFLFVNLSLPHIFLYLFSFTPSPATAIFTLFLPDALPICCRCAGVDRSALDPVGCQPEPELGPNDCRGGRGSHLGQARADRKSTRPNFSYVAIAYALFCF